MARNKNPNPYVRGRRVSAGKQGDEAAADAIALANDAKALNVCWRSVIENGSWDKDDLGALRRAGKALGIS